MALLYIIFVVVAGCLLFPLVWHIFLSDSVQCIRNDSRFLWMCVLELSIDCVMNWTDISIYQLFSQIPWLKHHNSSHMNRERERETDNQPGKERKYCETSRKHVKIVSFHRNSSNNNSKSGTWHISNRSETKRMKNISNSSEYVEICENMLWLSPHFSGYYCFIIIAIVMLINKNGFCDLRQGFFPLALLTLQPLRWCFFAAAIFGIIFPSEAIIFLGISAVMLYVIIFFSLAGCYFHIVFMWQFSFCYVINWHIVATILWQHDPNEWLIHLMPYKSQIKQQQCAMNKMFHAHI